MVKSSLSSRSAASSQPTQLQLQHYHLQFFTFFFTIHRHPTAMSFTKPQMRESYRLRVKAKKEVRRSGDFLNSSHGKSRRHQPKKPPQTIGKRARMSNLETI
eukprot:751726-Hanusia_phi.AAC.1